MDCVARIDRAIARLDSDEPVAALVMMESHATGLDRLLTAWCELDAALALGAGSSGAAEVPRAGDAPDRPARRG